MSEFFLELFTEEMPPSLQNNAKIEFLEILKNFLDEKKYLIINYIILSQLQTDLYFTLRI